MSWLKEFHDGAKSIIFLQETHSTINDEQVWETEWGGKIFFDHGSSSKSGVTTLMPLDFNGQVDLVTENNNGRKLGVRISEGDESITLFNLYAPTQGKMQMSLFTVLKNVLYIIR